MNFDPTKAPHIADDNWLAEAIVAKLGKENLLNFGPATYVFEGSWRCFDDLKLRNLVRTQIALLNEVRAEARLKPSSITANRVNSVASLLKMSVHKYGLRFNQGPPTQSAAPTGMSLSAMALGYCSLHGMKIIESAAFLMPMTPMQRRPVLLNSCRRSLPLTTMASRKPSSYCR